MTILDALGQYLEDEGVGVLATDIFLSLMPDAPDECVVITEDSGTGPLHSMGNNMDALDRPRIRVYCRAARNDYPAARALAVSVRTALNAITNESIDGVYILSVMATSDLYPLARDGDDRPIIGCDYSGWIG